MGRMARWVVPAVTAAMIGTGCGAPAPRGPDVVVPGAPGGPATRLPGAEAAERRTPVPVSPADVGFVTRMIVHHRQALEMAALAPGRAADPQVQALASRIEAVQGPEIAVMDAWLARQDRDAAGQGGVAGHGGHAPRAGHPMPGMATPAQMGALAAATGPAFDRLFVELMTAHHEGAIAMAHDVVVTGTDVTVAEIARDVAVTQAVEIDRMRRLLD